MSFAADAGALPLNVKIRWKDLGEAIKYIVGYSQTWPIFNPTVFNSPANVGPYKLQRFLPARHPRFPNCFCTKILSCVGKALSPEERTKAGLPVDRRVAAGLNGTYGDYDFAYLSLLFEVPKYPMMSDQELGGRPEYRRFCKWKFKSNVETIARRGERWSFCNPLAAAQQRDFAGDRLLRQAKGTLEFTWYDVHVDYVMLGRTIPSNFYKRVNTLNALPFPQSYYRDQNQQADIPVQFGPGTLLLMPEDITAHAQNHPAFLGGQLPADYLPNTVDVKGTFIVLDPVSDDTTMVDLSLVGGAANTKVRGHNLVPLAKGRPNLAPFGVWYTAHTGQPSAPPQSDRDLLHQYSNFEKLFAAAESL
jgi:hypothetical protein